MVLWYGMIYNTEWYACMRVHACANPLRDILPSIWSNCAESRLFEGLIYVEAFRIFFEDWNDNKHLLMIVDAHLRISWRLVPDDTCIHMSSTGATLPVHKVIHELPQVDRAVHLPSNSVVKRLDLFDLYCIINFQDFQDSTPAKLSSELGASRCNCLCFKTLPPLSDII